MEDTLCQVIGWSCAVPVVLGFGFLGFGGFWVLLFVWVLVCFVFLFFFFKLEAIAALRNFGLNSYLW